MSSAEEGDEAESLGSRDVEEHFEVVVVVWGRESKVLVVMMVLLRM